MTESSSHKPSLPKITPKEEPVTLDKPKSSNPFFPADQVELSFDEIFVTTNNEIALLYLSHSNSEYFEIVSYFISKFFIKKAFIRALTLYKEYLCEFWYTAKTLDDSKNWVSTPTSGIKEYIGRLGQKELSKGIILHPRWRILMGQIIQCSGGKTGGLDQISSKDATILYCLANEVKLDYAKLIWEYIIHKKIKEKVIPYPRQNSGAKSGLKRKQSLKHTSESKTEASKSKTGQSEKTQSNSDKDNNPSRYLPPTLVVGEMHKEAQHAAGGPTSLWVTSEERAHPQLRHDALADSTAEVDLGISSPKDSILA
uniref:Uncharacterized protein n=1 Tax=Tanacetum cinerariifolium TaxID=118510 RepID=A0A6L2JIU1_TANCI|nr:hypothetical protein [Tanacetum cinerariifolium]